MAQLKDDCFAFGGDLMSLEGALAELSARIGPVMGSEQVPLAAALNRIMSQDIVAGRDVPPHDNSAVDGYAVYFDDLDPDGDTRLAVTGRIAAGHPLGRDAKRGEALRIFTGAPMPAGPDTIFMEEDCTEEGDEVILPPGLKRGSNRRNAGEDVKKGTVIIRAGQQLRAQEIGLMASVGISDAPVYERLRVAVFSTGDEVCDPGDDAPDGAIYDANRYAIRALLEGLGAAVTDLGILEDDEAAITKALEVAAPDHDLLVTSGGVSTGEEDHVKAAVGALGQIHFWRLAIKPGRPIALGQVGGQEGDTAFLGLPGNPVAAMVTFMIIGRPLVLRLSGAADIAGARYPVEAGFDYKKKAGRREWVRVKLESNGQGRLVAMKHPSSGAGILTSMVEADGLVELAEDIEALEKGAIVDFLPFSEVTGR